MIAFANAKINLGLFLTDKRADGYHNLQTIFYPIKIHDVLELVDAAETSLAIKGLEVPGLLNDNLCLKVFRTLQTDYNLPEQKIILLKNIPIGAGLGGGSADAAFLIKLINDKFSLQLSVEQLQQYARQFGSDCAFFIENKPCFAQGKGDEFVAIAPLDLSDKFIVVVKPPIHVSTQQAYQNVTTLVPETDLSMLIQQPVSNWKHGIRNDFEPSIFRNFPEISKIKTALYQAGATFALMSGSGSSVFGIFESPLRLAQLEKYNQVFYGV